MAGMIDMEMEDERQMDAVTPIAMPKQAYPYGLRLSMTEDDLAKLELDDDPEHGDYLMLKVLARVTHCSRSEGDHGTHRCVELQVEKIKVLGQDDNDGDE